MLAKRSLAVLKEGIEEGLFSGVGYALVSKRAPGGVGTLGRISFDPESTRIERDVLFDVASLTKPLATAPLILQLIESGALWLSGDIGKILDAPNLSGVTVFHLLTHTSGLPAIPPGDGDPLAASLACHPGTTPGSKYLYSDTGYILLGHIFNVVSKTTLAHGFKEQIAAPLHLEDSGFLPDTDTYYIAQTSEGDESGAVHDPRVKQMGGVAGHAGLFASTGDIAAYARALLGTGKALMSAESLTLMFEDQLAPDVGFESLGWFRRGNEMMPDVAGFSAESVGHSGFTGCFIWLDRPNQVAACLLTNRVLNAAEGSERFLELRRRWLSAAAQDLGV